MPTILVVDDSLSVRKVAERMLIEAGLEVAAVSSGEEALDWLSTKRPDLVIADVIMPDKSGFDVCTFVRSNAALADTPVILVSGFVDDELMRQAEACRADGIIKKPFQAAALRERVLHLLSARKAQPPGAPAEDLGRPLPVPDSSTSASHALEERLAQQQKELGQASALIQDLAVRLAEAEKQTAELHKLLAALEPAAASAEKLLKMLGESVRQAGQPLDRDVS
ncbi:MAG: response regulator [Nitrospirae bacterium]|nr:MAG: response regulator [Nitrospirota bacterium]